MFEKVNDENKLVDGLIPLFTVEPNLSLFGGEYEVDITVDLTKVFNLNGLNEPPKEHISRHQISLKVQILYELILNQFKKTFKSSLESAGVEDFTME